VANCSVACGIPAYTCNGAKAHEQLFTADCFSGGPLLNKVS